MLRDVECCGIPRIIKLGHKMKFTWNGKTETFLVISPQCPEKYGMWPAVFVTELINYAKANLRIDPNRIYMTGLSMGGGGTMRFISTAADQPKQLAAAATICTPCTFSNGVYPTDAHLPVWAFHAADDPTASVNCTYAAINKMNVLNPQPAPLTTIWPTGGHIVWDRVYTDTAYKYDGVVNIYEWFLGQNKTFAVNKMPIARAGNTLNISKTPGTATLDASASSDPDGKLVRYVWKKISGPNAGTITTPFGTSPTTTITGLTTAGTYQYQLNVVDDRVAVSRDTLTIIVSNGTSTVNVPPVAKAGNDANVTLPTNSVYLNGTASSDQDGTISTYAWSKVSGPAATIVDPSGSTTAVNGLVEGTYVFKLKVTDNKGATSEDQVVIVVNAAANVTPVAKAGNDITITLPTNTVTLNGTTSTDGDGTISKYLWSKVSGPAATIVNSAGSSTAVNNLVEGTYVFKLKVTDNDGASSEDQVTVKVNPAANVAPTAKAGNDVTITLPTNSVTLNGNGSTDDDGNITSYVWTKVSGPAATIVDAGGMSTAIDNLVEGTYVFKLKVTDNDGASDEDQVTVKVNPKPIVAPVARAGADITITLPLKTVTLNGTNSSDADGTISSYLWTKVSGPAATIVNAGGSSTAVNNLVEGTYVFRLKVTDNDGASSEDLVTVKVNPAANVAPVARAGNDITVTLPENKISLSAVSSSDADGTIASYAWAKLTGPSQFIIADAGASFTSVTNLVEGTYTFRLVVTDNKGATDADTIIVKVNPAPPPPNVAPEAQAGQNQTITLPENAVSLNGTSSSDADGTIASYVWSFVSGPSTYSLTNATKPTANVSDLGEGTYTFRLEVKDNDGATDADTISITVKEEAAPPPPPNVAPDANAGNDITITLPVNQVTLDGRASTDEDGTITKYSWKKISGPVSFNIVAAGSASTIIENLVEGTYTFELQVKDNDGALTNDTVKIFVLPAPNELPGSDAGADVEVQLPNAIIELDGTDSYDPDGTVTAYKWEQVSGPNTATISAPGAATTGITGFVEGVYVFRLTVTDNDGSKASDVVKVTVLAAPIPNVRPVADAGSDIEATLPDVNIELDGSNSSDADGTITSYSWVKVSGPAATITNSTGTNPGIVGVTEGEYVFRLTVTDNDGESSSDDVKVIIHAAPPPPVENVDPIADAGGDQTISYPDSSATINGGNSKDDDGTISGYAWTMAEGPAPATIVTPSNPSTLINGLETGDYTFVLTVTDNKGATSRDTVNISVINTQRFTEEFTVYPNPAVSNLNVQLTSDTMGMARISIYNASGMIVHVSNVEKVQPTLLKNLNIGQLQTGLYYLEVIVAGKERKITKFIKRQ
jgi:hypothetical protein